MYIDETLLSYDELLALRLRKLFTENGCTRFKLNKFEEYDFYALNKDFLDADNILSFTDTNGKLMALKPDVTLSVVNSTSIKPDQLTKVYYRENVYRTNVQAKRFKELVQIGVECLGDVSSACVAQTVCLAAASLSCVSQNSMLVVMSMDIMCGLLDCAAFATCDRKRLMGLIGSKNRHELIRYCTQSSVDPAAIEQLEALLDLPANPQEAIASLRSFDYDARQIDELASVVSALQEADFGGSMRIDFSLTNDPAYYNGIAFQGFIAGASDAILSGGQYDKLLDKLGKEGRSVGFAVYVDNIPSPILAEQMEAVRKEECEVNRA